MSIRGQPHHITYNTMKRFIAIAALLLAATPANANINKAVELINDANYNMQRAVGFMESGDKATACRWFKDGVDGYASAYVLYPDDRILSQMIDHKRTYDKHC